jgi:hypothetical protein
VVTHWPGATTRSKVIFVMLQSWPSVSREYFAKHLEQKKGFVVHLALPLWSCLSSQLEWMPLWQMVSQWSLYQKDFSRDERAIFGLLLLSGSPHQRIGQLMLQANKGEEHRVLWDSIKRERTRGQERENSLWML